VNTYRVARAEVERVLSDFPELAKQVDVTAVPGGGLRLTVLRRGTLLDRLGLRQGDILRRVDDLPTGSPEEVLVAYARVRAARRLRVEIQRGRRSLVLTYLIDG
jgi:type II secretory pathway component PulC